MSKHASCSSIETDLLAAALGEAASSAVARVAAHVERCGGCRDDLERYRAIESVVGGMRTAAAPAVSEAAQKRLLARLAELRSRLVSYRVFASPLGPILIAATDDGISLVEYLAKANVSASWLLGRKDVELERGGAELERFQRELIDYIHGRVTHLEWPLDFRFARGEFQRAVLEATAEVPYGAVSSYAGVARDIGKPAAVRAVAQALRHNPLPIVVPCHRIVGSGGALVGYSGSRVGLKERLLEVEGVRIAHRRRESEIDRTSMYAWNRSCREYCLPTCGDISQQPIGMVTLFASAREAAATGLTPCSECRPDLHPLAS